MTDTSKLNIEKQDDGRFKVAYQSKDGTAGVEYFDTEEDAQDFGRKLSDGEVSDPELEHMKDQAAIEAAKGSLDSVPEEATSGTTEHHEYEAGDEVPSADGGAANPDSEDKAE